MPMGITERSTRTVTFVGAVPEIGPNLSQYPLSLAVQASLPPPALVILSVWLGGLYCGRNAYTRKLSRAGLAAMTGTVAKLGPETEVGSPASDTAVGAKSEPHPVSHIAVSMA